MVSSNRNTQEYDPTDYEQVVVVGVTNPSSKSQILTSSYPTAGGDRQPLVKNSQILDRAITRESQTHDVDVCGAGKAYNMVAKGSAIINSEMQS